MPVCGKCGASYVFSHKDCPNADKPDTDRNKPTRGTPKCDHDWEHIRTGGGFLGPVYDVWRCKKCKRVEERNR